MGEIMNPFLLVLIIITSLVILLLIVLFIIYLKTFYNSKRKKSKIYDIMSGHEYDLYRDQIKTNINKVKNIPYQKVTITSKDGLKLVGKYYHINDNAPTDIQCHGYKGNGLRDFSGGLQMSLEYGHNVLLIDHRGQGESAGHTITFGIKERYDVLDWIDFINLKNGIDKKIFLVGISMGAATVLMTLGLKLPKNVCGIIADSPYTAPKDIILKVVTDMGLPSKILAPFIWLSAFIIGRFKLNEYDVARAVINNNIPILLIHGLADTYVPCEMSKKISELNQNIQFETFKDAPHGMSYLLDEQRYRKLVKDFEDKILKKEEEI